MTLTTRIVPMLCWLVAFIGWADALHMGNVDRMMQWLTIIVVCAVWVQVSGRRA